MDLILISHTRGRTWRFRLNPNSIFTWLPAAAVALIFSALFFAAGWWLRPNAGEVPSPVMSSWATEMQQQRSQLADVRAKAEEDAHGLARRIALLQAYVMRLDAAGSRMTQIANIDPTEFNFDKPPPMGGPEILDASQPLVLSSAVDSLDQLQQQLNDRERQMRVLEDLLLAGRLQKEIKPSGWPISVGYITSPFGTRTDPFTGMRAYHPGIDFSAAEGSEVLAVASGIVTEAGEHVGYGNLVEINHGNGYVTRYGHNEQILVKAGDRIKKGQAIALLGSTGRSTGPHVHFEVLLNGNTVNPEQYIAAAR